ncbi:hypothetical protein ZTR_10775 [Talaromyces verruculosus]|nr:hypothetical protein ZTR_10775 [Talaromyces verruculosus]
MTLAAKAQLYAAHAILEKRADDIHEKVINAIEIDDDDAGWLGRSTGGYMSELKESSQVQAFCKVLRHARRNFPDEKIVVFSSYLRFLDILRHMMKQEFKINALRYDGNMSSSQKTEVQLAFASKPADVTHHQRMRKCWTEPPKCLHYDPYRELTAPVKMFRLFGSNSAIDGVTQTSQKKTQTNDSIMNLLVVLSPTAFLSTMPLHVNELQQLIPRLWPSSGHNFTAFLPPLLPAEPSSDRKRKFGAPVTPMKKCRRDNDDEDETPIVITVYLMLGSNNLATRYVITVTSYILP